MWHCWVKVQCNTMFEARNKTEKKKKTHLIVLTLYSTVCVHHCTSFTLLLSLPRPNTSPDCLCLTLPVQGLHWSQCPTSAGLGVLQYTCIPMKLSLHCLCAFNNCDFKTCWYSFQTCTPKCQVILFEICGFGHFIYLCKMRENWSLVNMESLYITFYFTYFIWL